MNRIKKSILFGTLFVVTITIFGGFIYYCPLQLSSTDTMQVLSTKVAIIVPHPDDETIGLGGWIQHLKASGYRVHCVLMACGDGGPSLVNYYNVTIPERASENYRMKLIREDAFRRVMSIYNCSYSIIGVPDGTLTADQVYDVMKKLYLEKGYTEFYTTTGDGSPDHKACHEGMIKMKKDYPQLKYRQFPIYWYRTHRPEPMAILKNYKDEDVTEYIPKKKMAYKVYYNIKALKNMFYPYSNGKIRSSPERIYYIK